ncbi:MAG TPA: S41 family peptidase [Gammaproteobacteria bacterium]|nr:S41 family peptidase [Gammaproteobacteria bacterium]
MRKAYLALAFTFSLLTASAFAQAPIPDTASGRALEAWLAAFNSGDRDRIQTFVDEYGWPQSVQSLVSFRNQTGGFDLLSVVHSDSRSIEFMVKERASDTHAVGLLALSGDDPPRIGEATLRAIPPGRKLLGFDIDAAMRDSVIDGVIAKLRERYVDAQTAKAMADALQRHRKAGEYDEITSGPEFAQRLTADLREVSHDLHLRVSFSPVANPKRPADFRPNPAANEQLRRQMARVNCGFEQVDILPGNVGYLKFSMFANPEVCGATATAAMNFLATVDALIIDLRDNGGGSPEMVDYVASYLFAARTHLNDLYDRPDDTTQQWWTLPYVPGERLAKQPVYVLTSKRTFSGAEEFTYDLQSLGRATVVGETTGGGAHLVRGEWINEQFTIGVPFASAVNPVTKTNWEGTGVKPDVEVPADEALDKARGLIAARQAEPQQPRQCNPEISARGEKRGIEASGASSGSRRRQGE